MSEEGLEIEVHAGPGLTLLSPKEQEATCNSDGVGGSLGNHRHLADCGQPNPQGVGLAHS